MNINNILSEINPSKGPLARVLHKGDNFKVLVIGFKEGMVLKAHKSNITSKLTVIKGSVVYYEGAKSILLNEYQSYDIPVGVRHSVGAIDDAICLLTQGE